MKTNNYTSSKFNSVSRNILLWGGVIILPIAFKHNIIAQNTKPDPDKPVDGGCKTCPPGPCDIWVLTQTIDWSQPSKTTTGLPIELGNYEENYNYVASEYQRAYSISVRYHLNQLNQNDHTTIFSFDGACLNEYHDAALIYQALSDALGQKNELQVCTSLVKPRENILREEFKIFPNPVRDILTLEFKESYTGHISIYDINGNQVHNEFVKELSQSKISVQSLPAGNYIIHTEDHKPLKFIKQ